MALRPERRYLSLFAGAGGLELALRLALPAARCVCYVEREIEAAEILAARIADKALDDAPVWSDVSTFDGRPWRGFVDGIIGGFPCQDLSVAGKRAGIQRGNRSGLFYEYARIIREVQPRWVFIENVRAVLAFPAAGIVLGELAAMGFDAEWGSLEASDVGASHERHRKFILAYRNGSRESQCDRNIRELWNRFINGNEIVEDAGSSDRRSAGQLQAVGGRPSFAPARSGAELAIADSLGGSTGISGSDEGDEGIAGIAQHDSDDLGTASSSRLEVDGGAGSKTDPSLAASRQAVERTSAHMVFAPGPADPIWNDVLVRDYGMRPALSQAEAESVVRGMADGFPDPLEQRIDSLRSFGNAVVPVQGAAAFRELARRAGER